MAGHIKLLIDSISGQQLEELDDVVEYLVSLALDEDTAPEDFQESFCGFFEELDIDKEKIVDTFKQIRDHQPVCETNQGGDQGFKGFLETTPMNTTISAPAEDVSSDDVVLENVTTRGDESTDIEESKMWSCKSCTFTNAILMVHCEMCGQPQIKPDNTPPVSTVSTLIVIEAHIETPTNALNSILKNDSRRRKQPQQEQLSETKNEMLDFLVHAQVSDAEHCRRLLERQGVNLLRIKSYSFDEFTGFGLSFADATCLFNLIQEINEKPDIEDENEGTVFDSSPAEVNELMFLVPDQVINRTQVEYIYFVLCRKSIEAASRYLVEHFVEVSEIRRASNVHKVIDQSSRWLEERARPVVDEKERERIAKENVMKRFDETPDDSKVTHRPSASYGESSHRSRGGVIRFLDGNKVNMKNAKEKFVIEDSTVEWDGGSRGKVKSKGKRGPGFVSS
mmetsp:Transcript_2447/g.3014  ORF Transcript_2447/g.3014 Transcript_2447/m.3014 type:complete len:451 (+) Transcript_2447:157-1509(+)